MKLTKSKLNKLYSKNKQTFKRFKNKQREKHNKTFRKNRRHLNLYNSSLKRFVRGGAVVPGEPGTAAPSPVDEAEAKGPDAAPIPVPADKGSEESPSPVEGSLAKGPEESPSLVPADKGPEASQVPVKESEEQKAEEDAIDKVISKQPDAVPDTSITVPIATPVTTTTGQIVSVTPPPMYGPELPPTPPTSMDVKPATDEKTTNADDQSQKPDEDIMNKAIDYIADRIVQKIKIRMNPYQN